MGFRSQGTSGWTTTRTPDTPGGPTVTTTRIGLYLAEAGFMSIVFVTIGVVSRALWDSRKER